MPLHGFVQQQLDITVAAARLLLLSRNVCCTGTRRITIAACSMQQDDLRVMQAYVEVSIEQEPNRSNTVEWHVPLQSDK